MEEQKKEKISLTKVFWLILILSIILKLTAINTAIYDDESNYSFAAANSYSIGFSPAHYSGLLAQWAYSPLVKIFGVHVFLLRIIPLLFSTLTIIFTFKLAKRLFSEKAALITSIIMITSFWHNLASIQIDVEGSFLTFFYILAIWAYLNLQNKQNQRLTSNQISNNQKTKFPWFKFNIQNLWKKTSVNHFISKEHLILGLTLIAIPQIKNNGIFIYLILLIASLFYSKDLAKTIKELFSPFIIGVIGNISILAISYLLDPEYIGMLFTHGGSRVSPGISILAISLILFWATPYLLSFLGLSILDKNTRDKEKSHIFIIWATTILILIICFVSRGDYSRYPMNIIPAISILGGLYLSKIKWDIKDISFTSFITLIYLSIIFVINFLPREMTPRVMEEYINNILSGNFFFLFSYTTPSGPIFGITMASFILTLIIALILTTAIIIPDNKKFKVSNKKSLILILFATTLAFNIFLIGELFYNISSPNISEGIHQMEEYVIKNDLPYPIYSNNAGSLFMLDNQNEISNKTIGIPDFELNSDISETKRKINTIGGTAIILNWPPLPEKSPLWEVIKNCEKEETFTSKKYEVGWVYNCN